MPFSRLTGALLTAVLASALPTITRAGEGPIQDNSFIIEEAYNQEAGVIQHISALTRSVQTGNWVYSFTEEWPVVSQTHQASVTINVAGLQGPTGTGLGDVALNYRWQAVGSGEAPVALAPRLSILLPTGDPKAGYGSGGAGLQVNVPLSTALGDRFVAHTNIGATWIPSARAVAGDRGHLTTIMVGQSVVWLAHRNLNFIAETLYLMTEVATRSGTSRVASLTVNPGVRAAINLPSGLQIVPGVSVPIGTGPSRGDWALLFYLSFEHSFRLTGDVAEVR